MADCVLCLSYSSMETALGLSSNEGLQLNARATISKHFVFVELHQIDKISLEVICQDCWHNVLSFNEFYERVFELHQHRSGVVEFCGESETVNPLYEQDALAEEGIFEPNEIKLEVTELEPLSKMEVNAEDLVDSEQKKQSALNTNSDGNQPLAELLSTAFEAAPLRRSTRRGRPSNVSKESLPCPKQRNNLPKVKLDAKIVNPIDAKKTLLDSDGDRTLAEHLSTASESAPRRRRGRPPKVRKEEPLPKVEEPSLKIEEALLSPNETTNELALDDDDEINFVAAENELGTDDSEISSSDTGDSLPDIEPEERYAIIPKRVVVKPKKYRKRKKPVDPPVRPSRAEIERRKAENERRKAEQDGYDEILLSFFEKFSCDICNLLVKNYADMRIHQRMTHNIEVGYMTCCGRKYYTRKLFAEHVLVHQNPDHFKCHQCELVFQDSRTLEVHKRAHVAEANGRVTGSKGKPTYQCEKCPKCFNTKPAFDYHNASKHVPTSEFKFQCLECDKKFPIHRRLKEHMRLVHNPETSIICDKCGKTLSSPKYLKQHQELKHSDEPRVQPKPVQCEICGTWLRDKRGLTKHVNSVHEPPSEKHICQICQHHSANSRSLKRHIYYNHMAEKKFKCGLCEKSFKRPGELREHTSTHTGEVLYTCPNCPMTFFCNANRHKHRQRFHRAEWEADRMHTPRGPKKR
ncbi:transcription factor grauzone-like [Drosophila tropicalis]|uniref:transcription factor grauzone-like n=1 Tax=Drosophila tropicalis TaxID=46794 RepID=UPI0035ABA1D1